MARSISAGKRSRHRRHRRSSRHRRSKHHRKHRRRSSRRRGRSSRRRGRGLINKGFGLGARSVSAVGQGLAGTARLVPVVGSTAGNIVGDVNIAAYRQGQQVAVIIVCSRQSKLGGIQFL